MDAVGRSPGEDPLTTRRLLVGVLTVLVAGAGAVAALLPEQLWAQLVPPRVSRGSW